MIKDLNKICTFTATPFGELEQVSPTISKCRLRIFYTGMTRNRTYITQDVAEDLILTLPYTPIKGIVDEENADFTDHGKNNDEGRIYGIVPSDPHFSWEEHLDDDNISRTYGCCDVYLFTALYPDAPKILGKPQSMELYLDTLQGDWLIAKDGLPYFKYTHCDFIGLQVLGTNVEPCFEGAAFYTLCKDDTIIDYIEKYIEKKEGEKKMPENLDISKFQISDEEKTDLIFQALNPAYNCETGEGVAYVIVATYDNYALVFNKNWEHERVYYTKTDDGNSIELGEHVPVKIVDVTAEEETALDAMKAAGNGSFVAAVDNYNEKDNALKVANSALSEEKTKAEAMKTKFEAQINDLNAKIETLEGDFTKEDNEKELVEDNVETYAQKKDNGADKNSNNSSNDSNGSDDAKDTNESNSSDDDKEKTANNTLAEFTEKINELTAENDRLSATIEDMTSKNNELTEFKKNIETKEKKNLIAKFEKTLSEETVSKFLSNIDTYSVDELNKELSVAVFAAHPDFLSNNSKEEEVSYIPKSNIIKNENLTPEERLIEQYKGGMK